MNKLLPFLLLPLISACESPIDRAVRNVEYSGYEAFGIEKRDLLKRRITATREDEAEAADSLQDSLKELRKLYAMPESNLSKQYEAVSESFAKSQSRAAAVHSSRERMETVAGDLFREWAKEADEIHSPELQASSKKKLATSKAKFEKMDRELRAAEDKMQPVLTRLKDQTLFLKHNLNAESLDQLKKEKNRLDGEIESLIRDMKSAIAKADEYIGSVR